MDNGQQNKAGRRILASFLWRGFIAELQHTYSSPVKVSRNSTTQTLYLFMYFSRLTIIFFCFRYSTSMLLGHFKDTKKFGYPKVLNRYQKPLLVFMRHLLCWTKMGARVIDITSGSGTTAVSRRLF